MPRARRRAKVTDKWRDKVWISVVAPAYFGSRQIAYIPINDPQSAVGRIVKTTLFDLTREDVAHYSIKLSFQIDSVEGDRATAIFRGHEYAREYLRSLVRRGSSMISLIDDYTMMDGYVVRVYVIAFAQRMVNASRMHAIRMAADRVLKEKLAMLPYDGFAQEVVFGKVAGEILHEAKKVANLRHIGVMKTKLIRRPILEKPLKVPSP